jgi:hypothetical protein
MDAWRPCSYHTDVPSAGSNLLRITHLRILQTIRTRCPKEQQEYGCSYDLVNELHSVPVIDACVNFDSAAWERLHAIGKKKGVHK